MGAMECLQARFGAIRYLFFFLQKYVLCPVLERTVSLLKPHSFSTKKHMITNLHSNQKKKIVVK